MKAEIETVAVRYERSVPPLGASMPDLRSSPNGREESRPMACGGLRVLPQ